MNDRCPVCMAPLEAGASSCPQCGFRLLGATQEFKPVSLDAGGKDFGCGPMQGASLRVLRGPQIGMSYKLEGPRITLGRDPKCSVFLNDMTVSRLHARIEVEDGCHVIFDENSYNGVWVNNKSVNAKALSDGDCVQLGTFLLRYVAE